MTVSNEPRKATDVLLELEAKINLLLDIVRSQDLNIKVLSNKLNVFIDNGLKNNVQGPRITVEAISTVDKNTSDQIAINAEEQLPIESKPKGFRRTSRPETYSGDNEYLPQKQPVNPKFPVQVPNAEAIVPPEAMRAVEQPKEKLHEQVSHVNSIPVQQRVVDKNGKSIFLADVDIFNQNGEKVSKTRTNGAGKWTASLNVGDYKIVLSKREALTKERVEIVQNIKIDGKTSPLELSMLIFK